MAEDLSADIRTQLATIMQRESHVPHPHVDYDVLRAKLAEITMRNAITEAWDQPSQ